MNLGRFAARSMVEILRRDAAEQPERLACTFLLDGDEEASSLSYGRLDRGARVVAAHFQRHAARGERAVLIFPPGLDYVTAFFGCLYAGVVAVPAYPPRPHRPMPQIGAILDDCGATWILTTPELKRLLERRAEDLPSSRQARIVTLEGLSPRLAEEWRDPRLGPGATAFLQYTSGSTREPRGVVLSHGNLLHNLACIYRRYGHHRDSLAVIWVPPYHDMGLIGGILQPILGGFPVVLLSPFAVFQRPLRWLRAISRYRATTSGGPNFAYELCVESFEPEDAAGLDLSSWRVAFNGAEPIEAATLERFTRTFAPYGFRARSHYPCFGLAEATLMASGGHHDAGAAVRGFDAGALALRRVQESPAAGGGRQLVGCGPSIDGQRIVIADPETAAALPEGEIGEIWIAGPSVARGYWQRPEETARTFAARLAVSGEGPFLRTGDLGFLHRGELFVTGRLKDLIIVDGRNVHPQDVERTVSRSHPALRLATCAALGIPGAGGERVVVLAELDRRCRPLRLEGRAAREAPTNGAPRWRFAGEVVEATSISAGVRRAVAEHHELRLDAVHLLRAGSLPKTSSGKLRRHACSAALLAGKLAGWSDR